MNSFCDCKEDGHCPRYNREMRGRMRELCAGVNVDLGTAAAFREQWSREASAPPKSRDPPVPLLLRTDGCHGDAVVMTAAVYSLHRSHPGKYTTAVDGHPAVFEGNLDVVPASKEAVPLDMHYPAVHQCDERGVHFMQGYCEFLGSALGVSVPLLTNRPRLYLRGEPRRRAPYWLVCAGHKSDFTAKFWGTENFQAVVDAVPVCFAQVGGPDDTHPRLRGCLDLVGRTSWRELYGLVAGAQGVLTGVTALQHIAAAFERPAVVVMGGREPVQWNSYPKQHLFHTVGMLKCCQHKACWKSRVAPLGDGSPEDSSLCEMPSGGLPACMREVSPASVAAAVLSIVNNSWDRLGG